MIARTPLSAPPRIGLESNGMLMTPEEFEAEARQPYSLAHTIRHHGRCLYGKLSGGSGR